MLLVVVDANGNDQTIWAQSQGTSADFSGAIGVTGDNEQVLPANASRGGVLFQNTSDAVIKLTDLGDATQPGAFLIGPGESWPPLNYPIPVTAINVSGTAGQTYTCRQW